MYLKACLIGIFEDVCDWMHLNTCLICEDISDWRYLKTCLIAYQVRVYVQTFTGQSSFRVCGHISTCDFYVCLYAVPGGLTLREALYIAEEIERTGNSHFTAGGPSSGLAKNNTVYMYD